MICDRCGNEKEHPTWSCTVRVNLDRELRLEEIYRTARAYVHTGVEKEMLFRRLADAVNAQIDHENGAV